MKNANSQNMHWGVLERFVTYLTIPQQAFARRVCKTLFDAVSALSLETLVQATVIEHCETGSSDLQFVVVTDCTVAPFPPGDVLVAWSGGLSLLCEDLQLRFRCASAFGISTRLTPFPFRFPRDYTATTVCMVTPTPSTPLNVESVVVVCPKRSTAVRPTPYATLVSALHTPCPMLCLSDGSKKQLSYAQETVALTSLRQTHAIEASSLDRFKSLELSCFPYLERIKKEAFFRNEYLSHVDLSRLPSLSLIEPSAFSGCESLQSVTLADLPQLQSIGDYAFSKCKQLVVVRTSGLAELSVIGAYAFDSCSSLRFFGVGTDFVARPDSKAVWSPFFPISTNERIVLVSHSHHVALLGHGWWLGDRR